MLTEQSESWKAIFEVYEALPHGWILVGGQAVYLHAIERNAPATKDADLVSHTLPKLFTHSTA